MAAPTPGHDGSSAGQPGSNDASPAISLPAAQTKDASIAAAPKSPPPEKPSDERRRTFAVLSFWAIVVFLGLPIWWMSTTIYRAHLPLIGMLEWADGKVSEVGSAHRGTASAPMGFLQSS